MNQIHKFYESIVTDCKALYYGKDEDTAEICARIGVLALRIIGAAFMVAAIPLAIMAVVSTISSPIVAVANLIACAVIFVFGHDAAIVGMHFSAQFPPVSIPAAQSDSAEAYFVPDEENPSLEEKVLQGTWVMHFFV